MSDMALRREKSLFKAVGEMVSAKRTMPAWFILAGLIVYVTVTSPFFLHPMNIGNVLRQSVILGIVSIGQTYVILAAGIDLSVGSTISLVSVLSTGIMAGRTDMMLPAVISAFATGMAIGLINGLIVTRLKVPDFLATLGMMFIIGGLALAYTPKPAGSVATPFALIAKASLGPLPISVIGFAILVAIAMIILNKTTFGRYIYAVGGDAEVSRLSGIKVRQTKLIAYLICGFTSALAGLFVASRTRIGDPMVGSGLELASIAAVVIGGTSLFGGRGSLSGTIVGVLIMSVLSNVLNLNNVSGYTQLMIRGLIIILVVSFYERKRALLH
jgi:ribose/xylose/arabinose/galactoside ABC-type transport system permease subunit